MSISGVHAGLLLAAHSAARVVLLCWCCGMLHGRMPACFSVAACVDVQLACSVGCLRMHRRAFCLLHCSNHVSLGAMQFSHNPREELVLAGEVLTRDCFGVGL